MLVVFKRKVCKDFVEFLQCVSCSFFSAPEVFVCLKLSERICASESINYLKSVSGFLHVGRAYTLYDVVILHLLCMSLDKI